LPDSRSAIEALEQRALLSASFAPAFVDPFPSTLAAGGHARVTVRLFNQGDAAGAPGGIRLHASSDASLDGGDVLLATSQRRRLVKPGGSAPVRLRFDSPAQLPAGSYYLIATVDGGAATPFDSASPSPGPATVASPVPVRVEPSLVDLSGRITRLPRGDVEVGGAGRDESIELDVSNAGNAPAAGPVEVRLYLSADARLDASDTAAGVVPAHRLKIAPGRSQTVMGHLAVPASMTPGLYYVLAVVDSSNAIVEIDETNNVAASAAPISVVAGPTRGHGGGHSHGGRGYFGAGGYYDVGGYYYDDPGYYDDSGDGPVYDGGGGGDLPPDEPLPPPDDSGTPPTPPDEPPASQPTTEPSSPPSTQPSDGGGGSDGNGASDSGGDFSSGGSSTGGDFYGGASDFSGGGGDWSDTSSDYSSSGEDF
jgi:hypothetical protein